MRFDQRRLLAIAALLVAAPTLGIGFFMDDWWHVVVAETRSFPDALVAMFDFARADDPSFPFWWRADDLSVRFFRPLSAALVLFDHAAFGQWAVAWHLHQLAWWVALVLLVRALFDGVVGRGAGALAALVFVFDDGHLGPFGWLASRQALVSAVFSVTALLAHLRWRRDGGPWGLASALAWGLAFLGGEGALGGLAYLVAWEAFGAEGAVQKRLAGLVPAGIVAGLWAWFYRSGGFGVRGSGWYHDPGNEPLVWLRDAPGRALVLAGQLTLRAQADGDLVRELHLGLVIVGVVGLAAFTWMLHHLRRDDPAAFAKVRWLVAGAVLSLVPVLSALPASRLLVMPSIGGAAALGVVVDHVARRRTLEPRLPWDYRWLTTVIAFIAFVASPVALVTKGVMVASLAEAERAVVRDGDLGPAGARVMVLAAPEPAFLQGITGQSSDRRSFGVLSMAPYDLRVQRVAPDRLVVDVVGGHLLGTTGELLFRDASRPLRVGDVCPWGPARVEVLAVDDVGPTRVAVVVDGGLDTPALAWRVVVNGSLVKFKLPDVGQERVVHVAPAGI